MEVTKKMVDFILNLKYEDLPEKAIDNTKQCIMDGVGVILAAMNDDIVPPLDSYVKDWEGLVRHQSSAWGSKPPPPRLHWPMAHSAMRSTSMTSAYLPFLTPPPRSCRRYWPYVSMWGCPAKKRSPLSMQAMRYSAR